MTERHREGGRTKAKDREGAWRHPTRGEMSAQMKRTADVT